MLFLHIGTVKTGTTYLQKTFHDNRDLFQSFGMSYLPVDASDLSLPRYANANFLYRSVVSEAVSDLIGAASTSDLLISEEGMFGNVDHLRHPVFEGLSKRIIVYLRPTADLISAWAAEFCRPYNVVTFPGDESFHPTGRHILPFEKALDVASHEYAVSIVRFMNIVNEIGSENIIVRPYERAAFAGGSLLSDFLTSLGLNVAKIIAHPDFQDPGNVNSGQDRKFCDISHAAWRELGCPDDLVDFNHDRVQAIRDACTSGDARPVIETMTDQQIEWFTGRFDHFELFISRTFLGGRPLFTNKYPICYGSEREPYRAIDRSEVATLIRES